MKARLSGEGQKTLGSAAWHLLFSPDFRHSGAYFWRGARTLPSALPATCSTESTSGEISTTLNCGRLRQLQSRIYSSAGVLRLFSSEMLSIRMSAVSTDTLFSASVFDRRVTHSSRVLLPSSAPSLSSLDVRAALHSLGTSEKHLPSSGDSEGTMGSVTLLWGRP